MKVKLTNVRLSFPKLFRAEAFEEGNKARYSARFLVEPGSSADKAIRKAIQDTAVEAFKDKAKKTVDQLKGNSQKFCYVDSDREESEGLMVLSANRNEDSGPPAVVDLNPNKKLTAQDGRPYAGCYVNATVDIWAQSGKYTGIRCALIGVQFAADGEAFGGAPATADDFDDLSSGDDDDAFDNDFDNADDETPATKTKKAPASSDADEFF